MAKRFQHTDRNVKNGFRNVFALGFVSFFTDFSTEMIQGILPIFIIKELNGTKMILGLIEGLGEAINYVMRMLSGIVSDRLGKRKVLIAIGYGLSTISKPFFAISQMWSDALLIRVSDRGGKGLRTAPRDALLSESIGDRDISKAFGIHRSLDQLGAIVGPLVTFILIPLFTLRTIFWLSFIPGFIAVSILLLFVKESRTIVSKRAGILEDVREVLNPNFLAFLTIIGIFSIGAFNFSFILIKAGELGIEENFIPLIYMVMNITHTCVGFPSGVLADRIGRERVLVLGFGAFLLSSSLAMVLRDSYVYAYLIAAIYGVYTGIVETVQRALVPKYSPEHLRGTAYGLFNLFIGLCFLIANSVFGMLWEYLGSMVAFGYSIFTSLTAIFMMVIFLSKSKNG
ncbi:MAG: MFS transporter [Nitrososphaerota archaeon]|nr:MFS transporter [Nitrososphaerales archaeon]MDW8044941.1 MFS transporter [Nitrososphaerota archaeon]